MTLDGRTALVTGGTGFLGRAIALGLREQGCRVVVVDRDESALAALAPDTQAGAMVCDLTQPDAAERTVSEAWQRFGPISILVNAVGMIHSAPLLNLTSATGRRHDIAAYRAVIDANLTAVFLATVNMVDHMVATRTRGVVVNLSSIAAHGNAGQGVYAAAKAGVNALTSAWAKELGPLGIRFVAVAPGFIDAPTTRAALADSVLKDWVRRTPLRRLGPVESVTSAVLFAITNDYLTGKVIDVDGGLTF
jgi:3-oxoacyl-[acyl-carrier protein] reductase